MRGQLTTALTAPADPLADTVRQLHAAGLESPQLEAELLIGHVLGRSRAQVLAGAARVLSPAQRAELAVLVRRRLAREPLPYILGRWEFFGLTWQVDARALIPRPETEHLVERAIAFGRGLPPGALLCDVGTGSGCIAVSLAVHLPQAHVVALDVAAGALAVAAANARGHGVGARLTFCQGDLLEPLSEPAHLIAANLPYVAADEWGALAPEVAQYEPRLALDGGSDGLDAIRRLLAQAPAKLRAGGLLLLEVGAGQASRVGTLARAAFPGATVDFIHDYAGHARIVQVQI